MNENPNPLQKILETKKKFQGRNNHHKTYQFAQCWHPAETKQQSTCMYNLRPKGERMSLKAKLTSAKHG